MAATIKDVARLSGLSLGTISKFINGGTVKDDNRVLIEEAIKKLDYKVNSMARALKTNKSMIIGVLIPEISSVFCTRIISDIEHQLAEAGKSIIICNYRSNRDVATQKIEFLQDKMIDGLIVIPIGLSVYDFENVDVPTVFIDTLLENCDIPSVIIDNFQVSYDATKLLIDNGNTRNAIICGKEGNFTHDERLNGFKKAHEDCGLKVDENLVFRVDCCIEGGYEAINSIVKSNELPHGLYITNYELTSGVIIGLNENNIRAGENISVVGFDNIETAKLIRPSLTIVEQPMLELAKTASDMMVTMLKGEKIQKHIILKAKIAEGSSIIKR